jgi:hypothetical protein
MFCPPTKGSATKGMIGVCSPLSGGAPSSGIDVEHEHDNVGTTNERPGCFREDPEEFCHHAPTVP